MSDINFSKDKKLILSMIQPTGTFTLGNYLGAVNSSAVENPRFL